MDESGLFTAALGLTPPWRVSQVEFDLEQTRLDLYLDFPRGARFACPAKGCGRRECPVHDTAAKTWRHMDFFEHKAFLHAGRARHGTGRREQLAHCVRLLREMRAAAQRR